MRSAEARQVRVSRADPIILTFDTDGWFTSRPNRADPLPNIDPLRGIDPTSWARCTRCS